MMQLDFTAIPAFGVAGNFTGHLEQAGEAADFVNVKTTEPTAPKALFPTYIPAGGADGAATAATVVPAATTGSETALATPAAPEDKATPAFLHVFPFDSKTIIFPKGEEKLQIEPECAVVFDVDWKDGLVASLRPVCFGASNDCSIRKAGAKKISEKKNWGPCSKGFSARPLPLTSFGKGCELDGYCQVRSNRELCSAYIGVRPGRRQGTFWLKSRRNGGPEGLRRPQVRQCP